LQTVTRLKPNVTKTLLKGTLAVALLSLLLRINTSTFANYLFFLGAYYILVGGYMIYKESTVYMLEPAGVRIKRPFGNETVVGYDNMQALGTSQGVLARRFDVGTVYIELKKGKGSHKSPGGLGVVTLKDVPHPLKVTEQISEMMNPYERPS
jgi:uncharacterized membrane protein YdbT with pleckstrin-like domain